jgi:hypothetical protein
MSHHALDRRLTRLAEANRVGRDPDIEPRNRSPWLAPLQRWQAARLRESFSDFLASPREQMAAEFFLTDLYGDFDVTERDREIERVLPLMRRVLPEKLLAAIADTLELAVLSHAFDLRMADALSRRIDPDALDAASYGEAYREVGLPRLRRHQIGLIQSVGLILDRAVSTPFVGSLLRMSRGPARAAGMQDLQLFLERGFAAFKKLGGAQRFVDEIARRELSVSERLLAGHPRPFEQT